MTRYSDPLPKTTYRFLAESLYSPLKLGENSVLLCPPLYGRDHRVQQIRQRLKDRNKVLRPFISRFHFGVTNLISLEHNAEVTWLNQLSQSLGLGAFNKGTVEDFEKTLNILISDGEEPTFFVNVSESMTDDLLVRFLALAQRIYYLAPARVHFLMVMDMKWDEDHFFRLTRPFRSLFQNTTRLSLYSDKETLHFLKYRCKQWQYNLDSNALDYIVWHAGGIFLLAKAALRIAIKEGYRRFNQIESIIPSHPDYVFQVKFFFSRLTSCQQDILKQIANGNKLRSQDEIYNLKQMGIICQDLNKWEIRSYSLRCFLEKRVHTKKDIKEKLMRSEMLSKREKMLLIEFLKKRGKSVSRDEIADLIWQEEKGDKYSDWAIDQTISRIRKKLLICTSLSHLKIKTHKKVGFRLE